MSPIKVGFVGLSKAGWASAALAPSILPLKDKYKLVAVSTSNEASAAASAQAHGKDHPVKPYHGSTAAISADPDVDLVAVAVRVGNHKLALTPALERGKDIFVEWPAGVGLSETEAFAKLVKEKGVRSLVGLQGRHSPAVRKLKQLVEDGTLGKILSTNLVAMAPKELMFWGPWVNENNLYTLNENGGGSMLDVAIGHALDTFSFALGPIVSVSATTKTHYPTSSVMTADFKPTGQTAPATVADQIAFTTTLASGAVSTFHWRAGLSVSTTRPPFTWIIDGEKGSVTITGDEPGSSFVNIHEPKIFLNGEPVATEDNGLGNIGRAWTAFAEGKSGDYATIDDAVHIKKVLAAIAKSGKEGRRVDV